MVIDATREEKGVIASRIEMGAGWGICVCAYVRAYVRACARVCVCGRE